MSEKIQVTSVAQAELLWRDNALPLIRSLALQETDIQATITALIEFANNLDCDSQMVSRFTGPFYLAYVCLLEAVAMYHGMPGLDENAVLLAAESIGRRFGGFNVADKVRAMKSLQDHTTLVFAEDGYFHEAKIAAGEL